VVAKTNSVSSAATKTITVQGRCVGRPVLIEGLFNVVITGVTPSGGCPADFPANYKSLKAALTSTIARQDPPGTLRTGSNGEVIKVRNSSRVTIKFLNIRDGRGLAVNPSTISHDDGLDFKTSQGGLIFCNCITNNEEGIDVDAGSCNQVIQNLVIENDNGIRASGGTKSNIYRSNASVNNGDTPFESGASDPSGRHDGLLISQSATLNNFENNFMIFDSTSAMGCAGVGVPFTCCTGPMTGNCKTDDGLQLFGANNNCIVNNTITGNGGDPAAADPPGTGACEVVTSSNNKIDCNTMTGNVKKDMVTPSNNCRIISGTGNTGSNVGGPACTSASCPAPSCTITPIP